MLGRNVIRPNDSRWKRMSLSPLWSLQPCSVLTSAVLLFYVVCVPAPQNLCPRFGRNAIHSAIQPIRHSVKTLVNFTVVRDSLLLGIIEKRITIYDQKAKQCLAWVSFYFAWCVSIGREDKYQEYPQTILPTLNVKLVWNFQSARFSISSHWAKKNCETCLRKLLLLTLSIEVYHGYIYTSAKWTIW